MGAGRQGGGRGPVRAARNPSAGPRAPAPVRRLYQGRQKLGRLRLWQITGEVQLRRRRGLSRRSCGFPGAPPAAVLPNGDGHAAITSGFATGAGRWRRRCRNSAFRTVTIHPEGSSGNVQARLSAVTKAGVLVDGRSPTDPRPMNYECFLSGRFQEEGSTSMLLNDNLVRGVSAVSRRRVLAREQQRSAVERVSQH